MKEESFPDAEARRTSVAWNKSPSTDPQRRDSATTQRGRGAKMGGDLGCDAASQRRRV